MILLVVVSCDKNDLGEDTRASSINVVDPLAGLDIDFDDLISRLEAKATKGIASDNSTSKSIAVGDYIKVSTIKTYTDTIYEFVWANGFDTDWCEPADETFGTIYLQLNADDTTAVKTDINGNALVNIAFPKSLYGFDFLLGTKLTLAGEIIDGTLTDKSWSF